MTYSQDIPAKATRLVMFALAPKIRPTTNQEYGQLIQEFASNPELRMCAEDIGREMGVQLVVEPSVLTSFGLFALLRPDSPLLPTLAHFRPNMQVRDRQAYGVLFFVIAAYVYPTSEALADDLISAGHPIRLSQLLDFAVKSLEAIRAAAPAQEHNDDKYTRAVDHLLAYRATGRAANERKNLEGMIEWLCNRYVEQGLFLIEQRPEGPVYYARPHYRLQTRIMLREAAAGVKAIYEAAGKMR